MEKIERIQYQAAIAVTGTWQGSSRPKLYEELGWESLSDRRSFRRILQLHKIENGKTPSYLKDKLPLHKAPQLGENTHNTFNTLRCRTNRYKKSFFLQLPDAITCWNIVVNHFANMPTFASLKTHIITFFRPKSKSIFGIHDPLGIRYLF